MSYLVDTCSISELVQKKPHKKVVDWFQNIPEASLYLSVLSLGEIHKGITKLPASRKKNQLRSWLAEDLVPRFQQRILPIDVAITLVWGKLQGQTEQKGSPLPTIDSLIAATALSHDLTLVTRNTRDMKRTGATILDLWS